MPSTPSSLKPIQSLAVSRGVDISRLPTHVAMIMDGNGRWATSKGLSRLMGHREGYRALRGILLACGELGIRYLTVYAFSTENWRRPQEEVDGLMKLIERAARDELGVMHRNNIRVNASGRLNELPKGLQDALADGIETTKDNTGLTFTLAVNYGGRAEVVDAVRKIVESGVPSTQITEEMISANLYNPSHPDPDLMIRTAGEMRSSNFLMWQSAYCELVVTQKSWPEFNDDAVIDAVIEYQRRTRKFGAVVE